MSESLPAGGASARATKNEVQLRPDSSVPIAQFLKLRSTISASAASTYRRFRSRPLVPAVWTGADLIIVMDSHQAEEIAARFPVNRVRIVIAGDLDPTI